MLSCCARGLLSFNPTTLCNRESCSAYGVQTSPLVRDEGSRKEAGDAHLLNLVAGYADSITTQRDYLGK